MAFHPILPGIICSGSDDRVRAWEQTPILGAALSAFSRLFVPLLVTMIVAVVVVVVVVVLVVVVVVVVAVGSG